MTMNRRQVLTFCALIAGSEVVRAAGGETGIQERATDQAHCAPSKVPKELRNAIDGYNNAASTAFMKGDAGPLQQLYSHCQDVTILGGFGGYEHGWKEQVEKRLELAAARFHGGTATSENLSLIVSSDLACNVALLRKACP